MKGFVLVLFFGFSTAFRDNAYSRLLDDLFEDNGYQKDAIPLEKVADKNSNENSLDVGVGISLIDLNYGQEILSASVWLRTTWSDYRLMWDPDQYEGITNIKVPATMVWRPDLSVYNANGWGHDTFQERYESGVTNAIVYSNGKVLWIPPLPLETSCGQDSFAVENDPEDDRKCNIKIGSWTYDGFHLNMTYFDASSEYLELGDFSRTSPYVVTSQEGNSIETKYYPCCAEPYMSINYKFTIRRAFSYDDNGVKTYSMEPEELEELFGKYKETFTEKK